MNVFLKKHFIFFLSSSFDYFKCFYSFKKLNKIKKRKQINDKGYALLLVDYQYLMKSSGFDY